MDKRGILNMRNGWLVRVLSVILCLVLVFSVVGGVQADDDGKWSNPYLVRTFVDEEGRQIDKIIVPGRPPEIKAAVATIPEPNPAMGINVLFNVPVFDWSYGYFATSDAMLMGYYDNIGYGNMYAGPTNGGVCPMDNSVWGPGIGGSDGECPLSATHQGIDGRTTKGHVDDYWVESDSTEPDPFIGNWAERTHGDCTGDYMGTNQSRFDNTDGETTFYYYPNGDPLYDYTGYEPDERDGCHGMRLFAESRGYTVSTNFNQYIYGYQGNTQGFTFIDFQAEIDAGRPVLIQVEGHTMLGYGYDTSGQIVYIHNTWDYDDHQMTWGGSYEGLQHYGVTVIQLEPAGQPDITVSPPSFDVTLPPNTTQDYTLTIGNNGGATLDYSISEEETTGVGSTAGGEAPALLTSQIRERDGLIELSPSQPMSFATAPASGTEIEIAYDDGEAEGRCTGFGAGDGSAVRFTPSEYPVDLKVARFCFWAEEWPDDDHEEFAVEVYDDDGAGGVPGTQLGTTVHATATDWGWWDVDISGLGITITSGDFYILYKQLTDPDCEGLCIDSDDPVGRSWDYWWGGESFLWEGDNYMIRCVVEGPGCPWLDEEPKSGTVPPGGDANITLIVNTTGLTPGEDYGAEIVIGNNDPDENPKTVPVTLHVGEAGRKGDFDGDGDIDIYDFVMFAAAYDSELGDANYNPAGDFDDNGVINIFDFVNFAAVYGT